MPPRAPSRPAPTFPDLDPLTDLLRTPPLTAEERLRHIRALGRRVGGYIRFMCAVGSWGGSSAEAKEGALAAFYECLVGLERQLARAQEDFQLGAGRPARCRPRPHHPPEEGEQHAKQLPSGLPARDL